MADKIVYEFDPLQHFSDIKLRPQTKDDALEDIKEYVKDQVLLHVSQGKSPVEGGPWNKKLSPAYKKRKMEEGGSGKADLELSGEMLDALDVVSGRGSKIRLQVEGEEEAARAEGNNLGSYGGDPDESKARRFIPLEDESLNGKIMAGIRTILEGYADEEEVKR